MLFLLPPSETKVSGGSGHLQLSALRYAKELTGTRERVITEVAASCQNSAEAAALFKLGPRAAGELENNRVLETSPVLPAITRYTGVLYDALDAASFAPAEMAWAASHVRIQSAMFGLLGALDEIPNYRLSASTRIPALGPLKNLWRAPHAGLIAREAGEDTPVLDMRSKDYGQLAPQLSPNMRFLEVVQEGADGQRRALNHFNKAAKGKLIRALAQDTPELTSFGELCEWGRSAGFRLETDETAGTLTLVAG